MKNLEYKNLLDLYNDLKPQIQNTTNLKKLICYFQKINLEEFWIKREEKINFNIDLFNNSFQKLKVNYPIEYITNQVFFCSDYFYVNEKTLIPRPETEELVHIVVKLIAQNFHKPQVLDLCTGCGNIGISIANRVECRDVFLSDKYDEVLQVANKNLQSLVRKKNVGVVQSDILEKFVGRYNFDVLVCNPPYIKNPNEISIETIKYEPYYALVPENNDHLHFYKEVLRNYKRVMNNDKFLIAFEIGYDQERDLIKLLTRRKFNYNFLRDDLGKCRFLLVWKNIILSTLISN
ncbi:hypothetical protein ASO20_01390 [Mycoplasma sp. (ex Biomphalaria glabrata)]|uniref:HemK/PrmC family methyltransferase n=1 Tax=Mycoplasma sp. (ex Biomphalaria glabrata) TaxID=1749074 RepID=UPI00073ACF8E|nr:HemK/PrmC family methyltransferase [Mycoplasma sp. (ex Biomphalaria glabrata)]ALV23305.1 hypothetical protein ASO20_01390 [Mycoplasma sp. (ex Biomphalaria glabrata)]